MVHNVWYHGCFLFPGKTLWYELSISQNTNVKVAKDRGENHFNVRPFLIHRPFVIVYFQRASNEYSEGIGRVPKSEDHFHGLSRLPASAISDFKSPATGLPRYYSVNSVGNGAKEKPTRRSTGCPKKASQF